MHSIAIHISPPGEAEGFPRRGEPVTMGVPLPREAAGDPAQVSLFDADWRPVPLQTRVLERWSDGSIRWLLLDSQIDLTDGRPAVYRLTLSATEPREDPTAPPTDGIRVRSIEGGFVVETGPAQFELRPGLAWPLSRVTSVAGDLIEADRCGLRLEDVNGVSRWARITDVAIEEQGPLRVTAAWCGVVDAGSGAALEVTGRLHFSRQSPVVRFSLTLRNPRRAAHPGNFWELGDAGSVVVRDASLEVALPRSRGEEISVLCSPERGQAWWPLGSRLELYQESSGGERWRSPVHRNRNGVVPHALRGYRMSAGPSGSQGLRATPIVTLRRGDLELSMAMEWFWQNFPKAIEANDEGLTLRLFPRQYPDLHELQGGEQKTHEFAVSFGVDRVASVPLAWYREPLLAQADPAWYCRAALPYVVPDTEDVDARHRSLIYAAIEGDHSFLQKREHIDEYGWRHFGDVYGDHEAGSHQGRDPLVSHYNNQYDGIAGMAVQFMRSGDRRWWEQMRELAAHVVDIDVYHTSEDKAAYNRGLFWHTTHYVDAGLSTHRSYPRAEGVPGGGPANEHNYNTGLMLHYFLTGNQLSRQAAVDLAQWVIEMDDGSRTVFRWVASGETGLASSTDSTDFHAPGRGAGNSILALLNGYRLTGRQAFLDKSEQLIRRCIHPGDDLERLGLRDPERHWSYTVFLQALAAYLAFKHERGQRDLMYGYARASLLHYARWMASNEYPYLEKPEILEFPTETWAAQEMRKSEVFIHAALHAEDPAERDRFVERSGFFFDTCLSTLLRWKTRTCTRPLMILFTSGQSDQWYRRTGQRDPGRLAAETFPPPEAPVGDVAKLGGREPFVPQKHRAVRRVKTLATMAAATIATTAVAVLFYFLS